MTPRPKFAIAIELEDRSSFTRRDMTLITTLCVFSCPCYTWVDRDLFWRRATVGLGNTQLLEWCDSPGQRAIDFEAAVEAWIDKDESGRPVIPPWLVTLPIHHATRTQAILVEFLEWLHTLPADVVFAGTATQFNASENPVLFVTGDGQVKGAYSRPTEDELVSCQVTTLARARRLGTLVPQEPVLHEYAGCRFFIHRAPVIKSAADTQPIITPAAATPQPMIITPGPAATTEEIEAALASLT